MVQGYKFAVFYPDLIDRTITPTYSLQVDPSGAKVSVAQHQAYPSTAAFYPHHWPPQAYTTHHAPPSHPHRSPPPFTLTTHRLKPSPLTTSTTHRLKPSLRTASSLHRSPPPPLSHTSRQDTCLLTAHRLHPSLIRLDRTLACSVSKEVRRTRTSRSKSSTASGRIPTSAASDAVSSEAFSSSILVSSATATGAEG